MHARRVLKMRSAEDGAVSNRHRMIPEGPTASIGPVIEGTNFRLEEFKRRASRSERMVIEYILSDVERSAGLPVRELAFDAGVSVSTVLRLAKKLGYVGYRDFQQSLIYDLALRRRSQRTAMGAVERGDSTRAIIHKVTDKSMRSLDATAQIVDPDAVDTCVDHIISARSVNLFGIGASLLVAKDLQLKLLRAAVQCNCCEDWQSQLLYAKNMRSEDFAIAISYSGMSREVIDCARCAKEAGATVAVITSVGADTKRLHYADVVLGVAACEQGVRSGAMASRIAQMNVVDIIFSAYSSRDYDSSSLRYLKNSYDKSGSVLS